MALCQRTALLTTLILTAISSEAADLFTVDTFSNGLTNGWTNGQGGNGISAMPDGGVSGPLDPYLRINSGGGSYPPKMAAFVEEARYVGDFLAIGATHVRVSLKSFSGPNLSMRLVIFDNMGAEWTSTVAKSVPAGSGWTTYDFPIGPSDITIVGGENDYPTALAGVFRFMFRHQVGSPSSNGSSVTASLGFDNIQIIGPAQTITGSLQLNDTVTFGSGLGRAINYTVMQGTNTIGSGTVHATGPSTAFSINVGATFTGAASIHWDGSSFLKQTTTINLTGTGQATGTIAMANGDTDGSGEVDAADIDDVIFNFGQTWPGGTGNIHADTDVSGEVDASDIDIVIANFGQFDQ